ncbi:MAG: hypothetical protein QOI23_2095 [Chloroflexota bacterium]|nr:hypothetical protein [Chloroflexota bacterium]
MHQETHVLVLRNGAWTWLGGGGGSSDEGLLADRPAVLSGTSLLGTDVPVSSNSRVITSSGAGGVLDTYGQHEPSDGGRWISYAVLRVSAEVVFVEAMDRRMSVPWHGYVLLVWCGDQPATVVACNAAGERLAELRAV